MNKLKDDILVRIGYTPKESLIATGKLNKDLLSKREISFIKRYNKKRFILELIVNLLAISILIILTGVIRGVANQNYPFIGLMMLGIVAVIVLIRDIDEYIHINDMNMVYFTYIQYIIILNESVRREV